LRLHPLLSASNRCFHLWVLSHSIMPWDFILIFAALAVFVPWRSSVRIRQLLARPSISARDRIFLYLSTIVFQWVAASVALWRSIERGLSRQNLGLVCGNTGRIILVALGVTSLLSLLQWMGFRRLRRQPVPQSSRLRQILIKLMPEQRADSLVFIFLVATVSICEEFLYRGFAFAAVFRAGGGSIFLAMICSAALFSLAHSYQGVQGLLNTFFLGLLFAACRTWTSSLLPPVAAHFVVDLMAGLVVPRAMRPDSASEQVRRSHSNLLDMLILT